MSNNQSTARIWEKSGHSSAVSYARLIVGKQHVQSPLYHSGYAGMISTVLMRQNASA
ncbi:MULTISPECIES: hypothetical protein [unclassified Microcoleus]|uniref:hypothetical protein n=1 Tax=unclassified Microcoleus TaxID=2642155 RepID=UPI002FD65A5D